MEQPPSQLSQERRVRLRLPRLRRAVPEELPASRVTGRDVEITEAVYRYRALDTHQIQALFFPSASGRKAHSRCQRRLQLLFHRGLLWRAELPSRLSEGRRPLVYYLDRKGAELLAQRAGGELGALDWDPKAKDLHPEFLEHLLATNQVRIALVLAAHAQGWQITRWLDDATLKREQMKDYVTLKGPRGGHERAAVVPDGYWVLDTGQRLYHHFLEIDRGTVTGAASAWGRRDWARKVATYLEYDRSGGYQARYQTRSWRVLTVTTGDARLQNLRVLAEKAGGNQRFWFTTFDRVTPHSVLTQPIWQEAGREGWRRLIG